VTVTCEFATVHPGEAVPRFCIAPAFVAVRWRYKGSSEFGFGTLCAEHVFIGCEQLSADPEVDASTVQIMRLE
jgi:hypothetical protein